ncbi:MAG: hypothetical protein M1813_006985 [Trichoglossum hirsutum]|nr:MAG: hypothetical protein M1813_006985 [Trichoglossum hirsutum]
MEEQLRKYNELDERCDEIAGERYEIWSRGYRLEVRLYELRGDLLPGRWRELKESYDAIVKYGSEQSGQFLSVLQPKPRMRIWMLERRLETPTPNSHYWKRYIRGLLGGCHKDHSKDH